MIFIIVDTEKEQWILAPKQREDTLPTATEMVPTAAEMVPLAAETLPNAAETVPMALPTAAEIVPMTLPTATEMVPTAAETLSATESVPMATERKERETTRLSEHNHSKLYENLAKHCVKWQEMGIYLGFLPYELEDIQSRPPLYATAPKSWLNTMLSELLQWAPGDQRGSTNCATLEGLNDALNKAGLSEAAESITAAIHEPTA